MSIFKKKENRVRVLFIDQKNDFASQMAEYFTTKFYSERYEAFSAGPEPDIIDCELISAMYQNGEDMRRQVSKDFENEDYLPKDKTYDFIVYTEKEAFDNADSLSPYPVFYPTKGIKGRDQQAFRKAAMRYPLKDTRRIIGYLTKMDTEMKSAGPDWMRIMMSELIAGIMLHKGADTDLSLESFPLDGSL